MITLLDGLGYAAIGAFGCFVVYRLIVSRKIMKQRQAELEARREAEQAERYAWCMSHRQRHTGGISGRRTVCGPSMEEQVLNSMMMEDREDRPSNKSRDHDDDSSRYSSGASYGSSYSSFGGSSDSSSSSCSSTSSASCD